MALFSRSYEDLQAIATAQRQSYRSANPYPHIVLHDVFDDSFLTAILEEFPDLSTKDTVSKNTPTEIKFGSKGERFFGPKTKSFLNFLNSEPFLEFLQTLTGIEEKLIPDPYFKGGGQHEIKKGGLLKIHADFNKHPDLHLDRRINVLIYLNKDWEEDFGGHFELWSADMKSCEKQILPTFNTMAIFSTTDFSFHGHPDPLTCPENRSRKSIALYYYSNGRPSSEINQGLEAHSTLFKRRDGDASDTRAFSFFHPSNLKKTIALFIPPIFIKIKYWLSK